MNYFNKLIEQKKKILIFGKNGQLSRSFRIAFKKNKKILQLGSKEVNFLNPCLIQSIVKDFKPDFIVNTSAYTNVNEAEINSEEAFAINSEALKVLADSAKTNKSILIHYSTDYIFDGTKKKKYKPNDIPNPLNIYGKSKLAGEQNIIKSGCNFFIFRISWLMSEFGNNFIKIIIPKIKKDKELFVVNDQIGSPISSNLVAKITAEILSNNNIKYNQIFHLSTKGKVSWYDIALHISKTIDPTNANNKIKAVKSSEYPSKVYRPMNSLFDHSAIENILETNIPFWKDDITPIIKKIDLSSLINSIHY